MGNLNEFFRDLGRNAYGLGENVASLGSAAIAEPVAGFAAMYDPVNGAAAIREGMTYTPRTEAGQMYQQGAAKTLGAMVQPAMPVIDAWQQGVDIAGRYSPVVGAGLRTVPTAIGIAMGAKPALQTGRQVSEGLGAMQGRMIANANAPRTLNMGFRGQRGAIGLTNDFDNSDEIKIIADYLGQSPESMLVNRDLYTKKQGAINSLVSRYEQMDDFSGAYYPTSYGYISISPSAKSNGQWQLTSFDKKMNPLSDQGEMSKNKALTEFFKTIKPNKYGNITPVQTTPKRPLTEFEQAHLTAQRNAALPFEKGGLGLPANNTAMDRARAMGWVDDGYHGTDADISEFRGDTFATYTTDDPSYASTFKDSVNNVLPLKIKYSGVKQLDKELNHFNVNKYLNSKEHWLSDDVNAVKGIDAGSTSNATALIMPNQLRSRFAAFDPFNRDSSNLLAQSAKLAPTTALGAYMYNEKRKKSQGKQ